MRITATRPGQMFDTRAAVLSTDERYRYSLMRVASGIEQARRPGYLLWVGLNPSTADAFDDDPTIRRMAAFTLSYGFRWFIVANVYAFRATDPRALFKVPRADREGPDNREHLLRLSLQAEQVIACWGNRADHEDHDRTVSLLVKQQATRDQPLYCMGGTKQGRPEHPLYLPASRQPSVYRYNGWPLGA